MTFSLDQSNLQHNSHTIIVSPLSCLKFLRIRTAKQNNNKNTQQTSISHLVYVTRRQMENQFNHSRAFFSNSCGIAGENWPTGAKFSLEIIDL